LLFVLGWVLCWVLGVEALGCGEEGDIYAWWGFQKSVEDYVGEYGMFII